MRARDHAVEALEEAGLRDLAGQLRQAVEGDLWVPTEKLYSIVGAEAAEAAAVADSAPHVAAASHQEANKAMDAVPEGITREMTLRVSGALRAGFEADDASRKAQVLGAATLALGGLLFAIRVDSKPMYDDASRAATAAVCAGFAAANAAFITSASLEASANAARRELEHQATWLLQHQPLSA